MSVRFASRRSAVDARATRSGYPNLAADVRATLIRFVTNALDAERFDPARVDEYLA